VSIFADSSPVGGSHSTNLLDLCLTCLDRFVSSASSSAELISDALFVSSDSESERARLALPLFGLGDLPFCLCLRLSPLLWLLSLFGCCPFLAAVPFWLFGLHIAFVFEKTISGHVASFFLAYAALHAALELSMLLVAQSAHEFLFRNALLNKSNAVLIV
jgi:hypothetical protein